jgi:Fe2+ transport system protein FeoA
MEQTELTAKQLKKGMKARVVKIDETEELCPRLLELGLTPGVEFSVTKVAPFGDPIELNLRGYRLCVRRSEVGCLRLVLID